MITPEYPAGEYDVYVLQLEGDRYYVGRTRRALWRRLNEHFNGDGAAWTARHQPVELVEVEAGVAGHVERVKTIEWMHRVGWENVRGGGWTKCDMDNPPAPAR